MAIEKIKKRDGRIVDFDRRRIERAMEKACGDVGVSVSAEILTSMSDGIVRELEERFGGRVPGVEDVQDVVERKLAENGLFEVAKAYILYREEHARAREEKRKELLEKIQKSEIMVKKRGGEFTPFKAEEIEEKIKNVIQGFEEFIDVAAVMSDVKLAVYEGITTREINQAAIIALRARIEREPSYSLVAARLLFNDLYKDVLGVDEFQDGFQERYRSGLKEAVEKGIRCGRLDPKLREFDFDKLQAAMEFTRDRLFKYLGAQTLYDRYFLKDYDQNILEVPQYFWMRVAMGLAIDEDKKEEKALGFYHAMSQLLYVPSTPTLFHSGTNHPQMSSCYLTTVEDDLSHIFKAIGDNAQLSKWSGGLGNDWTNIRGTGAMIKSTNVGSQGVIPFLKIVDATTAAINRSGKRRGATCVYLETWHYDIEDFLELRKNTGDERRRTHDTNTANWIPDLFMKRVLEDKEWTLFSPEETPELHHVFGKKFQEKYEEYEKKAEDGGINLFRKVKAKDLWRKMVTMLYETGHPWITFKDPCNVRSPQDHVGVVHSSNLCTEITLNTSKEETAVCNLGSVNLSAHVIHGELNKSLLERTVRTAMRMLDNVVDLNFYPTEEAKNSNLRHRPVGLGVMGMQDMFYELGYVFDSDPAVRFSDEVMEFVAYHAIFASSELAKEKGAYESYKGSKWDRGLLPIDTLDLLEKERGFSTDLDLISKMDWEAVRKHVGQYGMRNSNCLAIAPTATISNISGCFPSIEPIYKNIYTKSNFSGEFTVINEFLVSDLKQIGLWDEVMVERIKYYDGSVQRIAEIPRYLKNKYKEVFEMDAMWIVRHAAYRGKWIDQSQSVNIFTSSKSGKYLSDLYVAAWKMGLKTTYYLRTLGASGIEKSTLDINKNYTGVRLESAVLKEVAAPVAELALVRHGSPQVAQYDSPQAVLYDSPQVAQRDSPLAETVGETCEACQ